MKIIGNILWFLLGGALMGLGWLIVGLLWCVSVIGIPVGVQCFKLAGMSFFPFGKEIQYGTGGGSVILNILWIILGGLCLALGELMAGLLCCVTIIGIPFGLQHFKLARLALTPVGARIVLVSAVQ